MLANRPLKTATLAAGLLVAVFVSVVLAAAPLPKPATAYSTGGSKHGVSVTLVTSASGPAIEAGSAALGSQYALSGGSVKCRKAKRNQGFHEAPFAPFGFPGATLKLSKGSYGFSKTVKVPDAYALGSSAKPFKLKIKIHGTVVSATSITGTVKAKGGPCTSKKPLKFNAKADSKISVAPGK